MPSPSCSRRSPGRDRTSSSACCPNRLVKEAIDRAYNVAHRLADGVAPPERSLEACDAEALAVGSKANVIALAEGVITGAGEALTTLVDVPLLFTLSLQTIVRIGRCYSFALDQERDRKYVLGVLIAAASGSLAVRLDRLGQLRNVEDWFLQETQEEMITSEAASLLFHLEVFEEVPGIERSRGGCSTWRSSSASRPLPDGSSRALASPAGQGRRHRAARDPPAVARPRLVRGHGAGGALRWLRRRLRHGAPVLAGGRIGAPAGWRAAAGRGVTL